MKPVQALNRSRSQSPPSSAADLPYQRHRSSKEIADIASIPIIAAKVSLSRTGQLQYASPELRKAKGLDNKARAGQYKERLITPVEEIAEAFWDTKWGRAMSDELKHKRFKK